MNSRNFFSLKQKTEELELSKDDKFILRQQKEWKQTKTHKIQSHELLWNEKKLEKKKLEKIFIILQRVTTYIT